MDLRRRAHAELKKGEARNALARAVFFNHLGEIRDRSFEQQRCRASGLNLLTAAIVHWNTVYLERTVAHLRREGETIDEALLGYLSPLGWEHTNLTGDYVWPSSDRKVSGFLGLQEVEGPWGTQGSVFGSHPMMVSAVPWTRAAVASEEPAGR